MTPALRSFLTNDLPSLAGWSLYGFALVVLWAATGAR